MKIGVLAKQVPDTSNPVRILPDGSGIDESQIKWVLNPYDEIAVEEALKLKEKCGSEVVIVSAGPARVSDAIRQALALGADRGVRINTPESSDHLQTAHLLAKVCEEEKFDVIFAGKKATDDEFGCVHIAVGKLMNLPVISPVEEFSFSQESNKVVAVRSLSGSRKERVECELPAVIGCEKGLNNPRYASLPNIMKAKSKPIRDVDTAALVAGMKANVKLLKLETAPQRNPGRIIAGSPAEAAVELVRLLRDEAKVIQ